jgi:hypothetical protein
VKRENGHDQSEASSPMELFELNQLNGVAKELHLGRAAATVPTRFSAGMYRMKLFYAGISSNA